MGAKRCRLNTVCRGVKATVGFLENPIRFVELGDDGSVPCCDDCRDKILERVARAGQDGKKQGQNGDLEQGRSIDIPTGKLTAFWDQKRGTWRLQKTNHWTQSVETFYHPETRAMIEFETQDQAWDWWMSQA
jgi:hypothetical protein